MMTYSTVITAADLVNNLGREDWKIFDCRFFLAEPDRGADEYAEQHIPGAQYVHLNNDLSGDIIPGKTGRHPLPPYLTWQERLRKFGVTQRDQMIVYDQSHGGIAARMWWMLKSSGLNAAVLSGGWQNWTNSGLVTTDIIPSFAPSDITLSDEPSNTLHASQVLAHIKNSNYTIVDARNKERYDGTTEPIDPIAGHIPGAVNMPFIENVTPEHLFKTKEELHQRFSFLFETGNPNEIVAYCGSGVTACHNILAMEYAGYSDVTLYPGSWSDWIIHFPHEIEVV